jgi:hypothetical protein
VTPEKLLRETRDQAAALWRDPLYFVPIRHHSPACAYALERLLEEIRPATLLIEGPWDCGGLIPLLQDEKTRPPVALLTQRGRDESLYSAYFPLCDYSPEWIALRAAGPLQADVRFIDLPYAQRRVPEDLDQRVQSLMSERHLRHSQYLNAIAKRLGCRDPDESWDRLFEQRERRRLEDWRDFFTDVYAYCALARKDYEPEVIEANGDQARETFMAGRIGEALRESKGPWVVVSGGFHTPALLGMVNDPPPGTVPKPGREDDNWLIRFSFDQLDALNGYAAGMPSPGYYQNLWQALNQNLADPLQESAARQLVAIARDNRTQQLSRVISLADVQAAGFQAQQLARLRGCAGPGRNEVLDAVRSCFVKEAENYAGTLLADARRVLCGDRLGEIPPQSGQPPLLDEAWQRGQSLGLDFEATQVKRLDLELYRKPKHRKLSRYLHLMSWIDSDLAQWQSGPDFVRSHQLGLVREQWRYAWTPQVEARLLQRVVDGATLEQVALKRLREMESSLSDTGQGRRADIAATLLIQACTLGLHRQVQPLASRLQRLITEDEHLGSVTACARKLIALDRGRAVLESERLAIELPPLLAQCWRSALYLLPRLISMKPEEAAEILPALTEMLALRRELAQEKEPLCRLLHQMANEKQAPPVVRGAAVGALFQCGALCAEELAQQLTPFLQLHQPAELTAGCLQGLITVARETLWHVPQILQGLNRLVSDWPESHFLSLLPHLRLLFTELSPKELDRLAHRLAALNGLSEAKRLYESQHSLNPRELTLLASLDNHLRKTAERNGLGAWYDDDSG